MSKTQIPASSAPPAAPATKPFKFLHAGLPPWVSLDAPATANDTQDFQQKSVYDRFERHLTDVLLSEHLVILTGLGTSLCIQGDGGNPIAPTMKTLWDAAKTKAGTKFDAVKDKVNYVGNEENIEHLLSRCLMAEKLRSDATIKKFVDETEQLIVEKCRFLKKGSNVSTHEAFLRKVARRSTRLPRARLFTTNYDLCFEVAASAARFVVIDGFSHSEPQEFDGSYFGYDFVRRNPDRESPDYIPSVFHLYKLHGSLDWERNGRQIVKMRETSKPLIIYPRESKFESSYDQPFIEMMSAFQAALRLPNVGLLVIGFGFNDHHIAQPIASAIRSNVGMKAMVVSPSLETTENTSLEEIHNLIAAGDARLSMVATDFQRFVEAIPDLVAATEDELHQDRVRRTGARQ